MNTLKYLLLVGLVALAITARADEEQDLVAILKSDAGPVEKCEACKKLRLAGSVQSVPSLAALLGHARISQAARYALEGMPYPEAGAALRDALASTSGLLKAGVIDSLGWRADRAAVPLIAPLLSDKDATIAATAASALGRIGDVPSASALKSALGSAAPAVRPAIIESLLRCADRRLVEKKPADARAIYAAVQTAADDDQTRVCAYVGLVRSADDGGVTLVKSALEGTDSAAQVAALQLAPTLKSAEVTRTCAALLPKSSPALQAGLLAVLRQGDDASVVPAILDAAHSHDPFVQSTAMAALGELGDGAAVPALAHGATSRDPAVQAAARNALVTLHRGDVASALISGLGTAAPGEKLELVRALSARSEKSAVPELLRLARADQPDARKAAMTALGDLVDGSHVSALVQLLGDLKHDDARTEVRVVFEKLAERTGDKPDWNPAPIVQALSAGPIELRQAVLPISAIFVDDRLRTALRAALKDSDARIRAAAARALCDTHDTALVDDLLQMARQTDDNSLRSLALERVVRLETGESATAPVAARVDTLAAAMSLASRPEDKRMVLSGLAQTPTPVALGLAEKACADPLVRREAEMACLQIAQKLSAADRPAAEASLKRLAADSANPSIQTNAQAILNKLTSH